MQKKLELIKICIFIISKRVGEINGKKSFKKPGTLSKVLDSFSINASQMLSLQVNEKLPAYSDK